MSWLSTTAARSSMSCTALMITAVLAACGGGGSDPTANVQVAAVQPTSTLPVPTDQTIAQDLSAVGEAAPAPATDESPAPRDTEMVMPATADPSTATDSNAPTGTSTTIAAATLPAAGGPVSAGRSAPANTAASAVPIDAADIAAQAKTGLAMDAQSWGNAQCNGFIVVSQKLPAEGIKGSPLADGRTLRFGRVSDPDSATGHAFEITLDVSDPTTARSDRCELAFPASAAGGVPRDTAFWHAFAVKLPDLSNTSDEQAIAQWHAGDNSGGLLPIYTLLLRGKVLRLVLRYDESATPARATTRALVLWSTSNAPANEWTTIVTQALVSTSTVQGPFVKTWLNGTQIVDYAGPVGYNQPGVHPYAKHGIYHWVDNANPWDMGRPTRTLRLMDPVLIRDPFSKYTQATVKALVDGR